MNKLLADVYYLVGNSENNYPSDIEIKIESTKATELYDSFCNILDDEQKKTFEQFIETENHVQAMQENIIVSKAVALGIQIASEAFLTNADDCIE